jgi:hypothetical protein
MALLEEKSEKNGLTKKFDIDCAIKVLHSNHGVPEISHMKDHEIKLQFDLA